MSTFCICMLPLLLSGQFTTEPHGSLQEKKLIQSSAALPYAVRIQKSFLSHKRHVSLTDYVALWSSQYSIKDINSSRNIWFLSLSDLFPSAVFKTLNEVMCVMVLLKKKAVLAQLKNLWDVTHSKKQHFSTFLLIEISSEWWNRQKY